MLLQQLNTIATLYLSKWIDTGNKILDNTMLSIILITVTTILTHFAKGWRDLYNMVVYYIYRMYRHPLQINQAPYMISQTQYESVNVVISDNPELYPMSDAFYLQLKEHNISYDTIQLHTWTMRYKVKNDLITLSYRGQPISKSHANPETYSFFPIAISSKGNTIYFDPYNEIVYSKSIVDSKYIGQLFIKELIHMILHDTTSKTSSDEVYIIKKSHSQESPISVKTIGKVSKKKTFDTLFYTQKSELIAILQRFKQGNMYPPHIPMDNKLGILLYGPPGTGKTGTISAIANMLHRSIVIINFSEITTCAQLDCVLKTENYSKEIYVFDEFDCILDVISGNTPVKQEQKSDWGNILMFAEGEERKSIIDMMKEGRARASDATIDMAYLLQKLDGLEGAEHRMIIATTNNPEKINPSLLRPGRFDVKICLGNCTQQMVCDILTNFYQGDEKVYNQIKRANIQCDTYSPLELINMAIQAQTLDKLLKQLTHKA